MPEPMRESGPDFVVVGSDSDATCSTTARDSSTVLLKSSSAFVAVFLSGSGALLLKLFNILASPFGHSSCNPAPNVIMPSGRLIVRTDIFGFPLGGQLRQLSAIRESAAMYFGMDAKAHDELRYNCTPHSIKASELAQATSALSSRAKQEPPHARSHGRNSVPLPCTLMSGKVRRGGKTGAQPSASTHPSTRH